MNCQKCNTEAIKNHANNKEFYYCKTCKVEVTEKTEEIEILETAAEWAYDTHGPIAFRSGHKNFPDVIPTLNFNDTCVCYNPHVVCWVHAKPPVSVL